MKETKTPPSGYAIYEFNSKDKKNINDIKKVGPNIPFFNILANMFKSDVKRRLKVSFGQNQSYSEMLENNLEKHQGDLKQLNMVNFLHFQGEKHHFNWITKVCNTYKKLDDDLFFVVSEKRKKFWVKDNVEKVINGENCMSYSIFYERKLISGVKRIKTGSAWISTENTNPIGPVDLVEGEGFIHEININGLEYRLIEYQLDEKVKVSSPYYVEKITGWEFNEKFKKWSEEKLKTRKK